MVQPLGVEPFALSSAKGTPGLEGYANQNAEPTLADLNEQDFMSLVTNGVAERRDLPGATHNEVKEFLPMSVHSPMHKAAIWCLASKTSGAPARR
jgi:hypothetical protein